MKILVISATIDEVLPFLQELSKEPGNQEKQYINWGENLIKVLVSGAGILNTAYCLTREILNEKPDIVINAGITGSFDKTLELGEVVQVTSEILGDLGAQDSNGNLLSIHDLGLALPVDIYDSDGRLCNHLICDNKNLRQVSGITVNKVHGQIDSINAILRKYPGIQIESMEGAAVFHVCLKEGVKFLQLRAISNYVEPRNRDAWKVSLAIQNLNDTLLELMNEPIVLS